MTIRLAELIIKKASDGILLWIEQLSLAHETGSTLREIEQVALERGIIPERYQRNLGAISGAEQLQLFKAGVAVIGCGGLGGYLIEQLARLGVGTIHAWDDDVFEENNLNRQLLAQIPTLGQAKVNMAAERIALTNPVVSFIAHNHRFNGMTEAPLLDGVQVVVDALDNVPARLALAQVCRELNLPLVHGAINGWYGQVAVQMPGDDIIEQIYGSYEADKDQQLKPSVLSFVPAVIASLEAALTVKIILGRGDLRQGQLLAIDLLSMDINALDLGP